MSIFDFDLGLDEPAKASAPIPTRDDKDAPPRDDQPSPPKGGKILPFVPRAKEESL